MNIYDDAIAEMAPGDTALMPRGGHDFKVTATKQTGLNTGRRRYKVECGSCGELVHEATTGPEHWMRSHVNEFEARSRR